MSEKFKVFLRVRKSANKAPWFVKDGCLYRIVGKDTQIEYPCFTYVFRNESTEDIFRMYIKESVVRFLEGKNCTIFAYGQTGSGKTYTMTGTHDSVIGLSLKTIFEQYNSEVERFNSNARRIDAIERFNDNSKGTGNINDNLFFSGNAVYDIDKKKTCSRNEGHGDNSMHELYSFPPSHHKLGSTISFINTQNKANTVFAGYPSIEISYIEIYNEQIFDLINSNKKLRLFSVENTLVIANLTKVEVKTLKNALEILEKSEKNRSISQTKFNDRSSRSHTLFQIEYKSYNQVSVLNLIDLAGSEKAADDRERRMEGAYINRSLLALGSVVENLISNTNSENVYSETPDKIVSTSGNCMSKNKRAATSAKSTISNSYVNFRNSKLTRILQSSMIGDVELISLCMINEDKSCVEESISTLNFASRMSQVKVKTKVSKGSNNKMKRCPYCRKEVSIDSLISEENNNCYLKPVSYSKKDKTGNFNQQNNTSSEETFNANEDNNRPAKSFENSNQTSALENESGFKNSQYLNMERFEEKVGYKIQDDFRHDYAIFEEKMLLLKRIDTLENMLTSLLAKNPSHKSTEIYLLEKNVFNLQYDLIKKKQRNFRG